MKVTFLNTIGELNTLLISKIVTCNSTNSVYLYFIDDNDARDVEMFLRQKNYKTEHSEKVVRVFNFNSFDIIMS